MKPAAKIIRACTLEFMLAAGERYMTSHQNLTHDLQGDLHFAISKAEIDQDWVIAPSVKLRQTYAHTFAHPILATVPPDPKSAVFPGNPGPWHAVSAPGLVETATVELIMLEDSSSDIDRVIRARNIMSLVRLIAGWPIRSPVYTNVAFSEMAGIKSCNVIQFEPPINWPMKPIKMDDKFIRNVQLLMDPLSVMLRDDQFSAAFNLSDSIWWIPTLSAQMITVWAAAEALMRPNRPEITKNLARLIRAYAGMSRQDGENLYRDVIKLCRSRGAAVHSGKQPDPVDVENSYLILRLLLLRALSESAVPGQIDEITPLWAGSTKD